MQKYHSAKVVKFLANQQCYTSHILSGISAGEGIGQGDQPTHLPDLSGEDQAASRDYQHIAIQDKKPYFYRCNF